MSDFKNLEKLLAISVSQSLKPSNIQNTRTWTYHFPVVETNAERSIGDWQRAPGGAKET